LLYYTETVCLLVAFHVSQGEVGQVVVAAMRDGDQVLQTYIILGDIMATKEALGRQKNPGPPGPARDSAKRSSTSVMAASAAAPDTSPPSIWPRRSPVSAVPRRSGANPTSDSPAT